MRLTYWEAYDRIIEHTEVGYSIASQDRLWLCFIFGVWSKRPMRYERLYPTLDSEPWGWSYEMFADDVLMWTTRAEAEKFASEVREFYARSEDCDEKPEVYVMNLGDDARWETLVFGGRPSRVTVRTEPKFAGSRAAWDAMNRAHRAWRGDQP